MPKRVIKGFPNHDFFFVTIVCGTILILSGIISLAVPENVVDNYGAAYGFRKIVEAPYWQLIFILVGVYNFVVLTFKNNFFQKSLASFLGCAMFTWGFFTILFYGSCGITFSTVSWPVLAVAELYGFYRLTKRIE